MASSEAVLHGKRDGASKLRMLAALDRLDARIAEVGEKEARASADLVARWRANVGHLAEPADSDK